jgi:hypothetical protein
VGVGVKPIGVRRLGYLSSRSAADWLVPPAGHSLQHMFPHMVLGIYTALPRAKELLELLQVRAHPIQGFRMHKSGEAWGRESGWEGRDGVH